MSARVLRFPGSWVQGPGIGGPDPRATRISLPVPAVDAFDPEQARSMLSILDVAQEKAEILLGVVHSNRNMASGAGIEGIGIEILTIQMSERFIRMKDALGEAVRRGEGVTLTHDGLGKLHRLEALVSEAEQQLSRSTMSGGFNLSGRQLSQSVFSSSSFGSNLVVFGAILTLGAVAITLAIALIKMSKR